MFRTVDGQGKPETTGNDGLPGTTVGFDYSRGGCSNQKFNTLPDGSS